MAQQQVFPETLAEEDGGPVIPRRPVRDTADLDITPMIDIVFLLLIFFLVASTADVQTSVELPPARYGKGVSEKTSAIITIAERGGPGPALVYLADGTAGSSLPDDPAVQQEQIVRFVRESDKSDVLVKAEKGVLHREVSRVASAVGQVEGVKLHLAVLEVD